MPLYPPSNPWQKPLTPPGQDDVSSPLWQSDMPKSAGGTTYDSEPSLMNLRAKQALAALKGLQ